MIFEFGWTGDGSYGALCAIGAFVQCSCSVYVECSNVLIIGSLPHHFTVSKQIEFSLSQSRLTFHNAKVVLTINVFNSATQPSLLSKRFRDTYINLISHTTNNTMYLAQHCPKYERIIKKWYLLFKLFYFQLLSYKLLINGYTYFA